MNFNKLLDRLRNEPEWAVLIGLLVLMIIAGGAFFYYQRQNRIQSAKNQFREALNVYTRAEQTRQYQRAIETLGRYVNNFPDSVQTDKALFFLGKSYYRQGEYVQAIKQFKQLLKSHPESLFAETARLHLGYANMRRGRGDAARNAFRILTSREESHPLVKEARWQMALIDLRKGRSDSALKQLQELRSDQSKERTYWSNWARILSRQLQAES